MKQIFFCKPPVPGKVKTRLASFFGEDVACEFYRHLLANSWKSFDPELLEFHAQDAEKSDDLLNLLPAGTGLFSQKGNDLGERMAFALHETALRTGEDVLLAGTDIPEYSATIARKAARILREKDFVLGPASDGGYYLIGVSARKAADVNFVRRIFQQMEWSSPDVFEKQKEKLEELGYSPGILETLDDVDDIHDILAWRKRGIHFPEHLMPDIRAVLPVLNEVENLPFVLNPLLESGIFREVICADNGSTDGSVELALSLGAKVTSCSERGYGAALLAAMADVEKRGGCDVLLFLDADGADDPSYIFDLLAPVASGKYDFSLGHRNPELSEPGSVLPHARFGNWLAVTLIRFFWSHAFRDLGPFRALRWDSLMKLKMSDRNFGWTIEMQIRALKEKLRIVEIPVRHRKRHAGVSKVSSTLTGSFRAGQVILGTVLREWLKK